MRSFARLFVGHFYSVAPIAFFILAVTYGNRCHAQNADQAGASGWLARVSATQAEQPHWITPLATVTPRLEQEIRYDNFWEDGLSGGASLTNYDGGKGLELIPARRVEIILGVPPYIVHHNSSARDGIGDTAFLLKYRLLSGNESHGNYILSAFLGITAATATNGNGAGHGSVAPTLAVGKGWGDFDFQSTWGTAIPIGAVSRIGTPIIANNAFQYRVLRKFWPEMEVNSTWWSDGTKAGKKQVFLTPGIVYGKLPIHNRIGLTLGAGFQIAATRFHTFNHNIILSVRMPF
ncbi:MAG TPA: hypothetical protein VGR94_00925 [Candidatus Acidoferrales bacterium]|nr:hypothetical protein [Candidatus Acidoferrales bacterium]